MRLVRRLVSLRVASLIGMDIEIVSSNLAIATQPIPWEIQHCKPRLFALVSSWSDRAICHCRPKKRGQQQTVH